MSREIRITVDDDEVFERMKSRKRDLDLSWEEVLHRGLRRDDAPPGPAHDPGVRDRHGRPSYQGPHPPDPLGDPGGFAEDLKRQIQGQIRNSVLDSIDSEFGEEYGRDQLETEVTSLESAEDATLVFDFLGEAARDPANQVPLRVALEASADGLAVDVVAVRQGKTVTDMNAFDPAVRRRIVERLAAGDPATLRLEAGDERYDVSPILSWSRAEGTPTVADVEVEEVRFDDE